MSGPLVALVRPRVSGTTYRNIGPIRKIYDYVVGPKLMGKETETGISRVMINDG